MPPFPLIKILSDLGLARLAWERRECLHEYPVSLVLRDLLFVDIVQCRVPAAEVQTHVAPADTHAIYGD